MKDNQRVDRWIDDLESNLATARELASRDRAAFEKDPALQLAFEALSNRVGDLAKKLTTADPKRFSDPVWSQAARNRDFAVPHYGRVDLNILWQTVAVDFAKLQHSRQ